MSEKMKVSLTVEAEVEKSHIEDNGVQETVVRALREFGFEKVRVAAKAQGVTEELLDAVEAMVATAFGDDYGLTKDDIIEAMKMAATALKEALALYKHERGHAEHGKREWTAKDECINPIVRDER